MKRFAPVLALLAALAANPALGRDVPPESDRVLWCASALYWLAASAEDTGDATEAELYDGWSAQLLDRAGIALTEAGFPAAEIETLISDYDERVLSQIGTAEAPYDVATCPELIEQPG